ncbi:hypothetical protein [Azospirillum sp.]|uniref:hypothetical protein n=1 Tax=Azospirillum sp. TaxID=34012 RepID=UPI002D5832B3|nr:hypothetical protein [Azospirillum sp.]HYD66154.1 hypothetical protein [Azospirillum sp.]
MLTAIMLLTAGILLALGATLCALAKSGPQETLGGVIVMLGVLSGLLAGLTWLAGI